ncbi:hypothetical protein M9H77_02597 [Catharanthus roseus]|uniref:Uncharacterized protein n=1 Tax=Catharanthus roseus TaxID=4058 RepID=A0ACC0C913_CATRO|nr:hypothetical protein M9H77_02597 [Catharanthus roseus]
MVNVKNANIGRCENVEEGGSSRGRIGNGKGVASRVRAPERVRNKTHQWVLSRVGGRDISFDDRLLNTILETPDDGIRFYTKNKKFYDPNLYSERRFEEIFTKGEVLKRHDDRNINKFDAYGRLLYHVISNIIIPNVGHKSSITNMHSFVMLVLHEHRRMNFGYMAIEHMLATQTSSTKCLPYGCFLTKIFQYFVLNLVGVGDPIRAGKIYNKHTFKRMGFEKNEEGMFIRGGQDESDEDNEDVEGNEGQEAMNVDKEYSKTESEEETHRREIRQKKRQEQAKEGSSSDSMTQVVDMIASLQASMNSRFDVFDGHFDALDGYFYALDGKIADIQERVTRMEARDRDEGH